MNVLVNGASGYIGYYLTKELAENGHKVYAVCRKNHGLLTNLPEMDNINVITCGQDKLKDAVSGLKIDVWYHLLWEGACGPLRAEPALQLNNERMAVEAMELAASIGCGKIIFAGTVYERFVDSILENNNFSGSSFYIISKKHAHEKTFQLSKKLNIEYIWCQFCHPVGVYMNESQLIPGTVRSFLSGRSMEYGRCNRYFDIIDVADLAAAFRLLGEKKSAEAFYYIGSGKPRILREYIEEAAEICGYKGEILFTDRDDGLVFRREWFDTEVFDSEFGFSAKHNFRDSITSISEYYRGKI